METITISENKHCNSKVEKEKRETTKEHNKQKKIIKNTKKQTHDKSKETNKSEWLTSVTAEDLKKLCDQLSNFNTKVQTIKPVIQLRYDLPNKLQEKLEVEAEELASLYRELQNAIKNLELYRNQRMALVKEKLCIETQLDKLKANAVNELEVIVSVYDNIMMDRWEAVKSGNNLMAVENLMQDIKGKLQAMKNLQILVTQKLADLKKVERKGEQNDFKKQKNNNKESTSLNECNNGNVSQTSLPSFPDTDSEEFLDDNSGHSELYNLVGEHLLALPPWIQGVMDTD